MDHENAFTNRSYGAVRRRVNRAPRQLTLSLFAYVVLVFVAHVFWGAALASTLIPRLDGPHAMALVAILGTMISPYLLFWQSSREVEEAHRRHLPPLRLTPRKTEPVRIRTDNVTGTEISNLIAFFIVVAIRAGGDADRLGVTDIRTSSQVAEALRPADGAAGQNARIMGRLMPALT